MHAEEPGRGPALIALQVLSGGVLKAALQELQAEEGPERAQARPQEEI